MPPCISSGMILVMWGALFEVSSVPQWRFLCMLRGLPFLVRIHNLSLSLAWYPTIQCELDLHLLEWWYPLVPLLTEIKLCFSSRNRRHRFFNKAAAWRL